MERSRRGKRKRKLLANHQRCWLWGRNLVRETLSARRWPILELYLSDDLESEQLAEAANSAKRSGVRVEVVESARLRQLCHSAEHQGYLAKMAPYPYVPIDRLFAALPKNGLYLILDAIQDPYNFGAMLRSAGAFGVDGVIVGAGSQAGVSSQVARSSAGVVNRVPIAQVEDLAATARTLRERNIQVVGASEKTDLSLTDCDFRRATAIVLGNEASGISPELARCCDAVARIPLADEVDSLNAAAAAAVFLFEVRRQRERETHPGH